MSSSRRVLTVVSKQKGTEPSSVDALKAPEWVIADRAGDCLRLFQVSSLADLV